MKQERKDLSHGIPDIDRVQASKDAYAQLHEPLVKGSSVTGWCIIAAGLIVTVLFWWWVFA